MGVKEKIDETIEKVKEKVTGGEEAKDPHTWKGSDPHAEFEQMHPAVGKEEPQAFANPVESGAKKPSEDKAGKPMREVRPEQIQPGSEGDVHHKTGADPHAEFEQMHPAVNKDEPEAFANPAEAGAKKPSEDAGGKPMPKSKLD